MLSFAWMTEHPNKHIFHLTSGCFSGISLCHIHWLQYCYRQIFLIKCFWQIILNKRFWHFFSLKKKHPVYCHFTILTGCYLSFIDLTSRTTCPMLSSHLVFKFISFHEISGIFKCSLRNVGKSFFCKESLMRCHGNIREGQKALDQRSRHDLF